MKILVTDDSNLSRAITRDALVKLGHEVICAASGEEAIKLFQAEHPDLIILDVVMEGMGGFKCASALRALNKKEWIPIIFLSSIIDDESIAKGIDAGGDDYLSKPFSKITLSAKIKSMERIADMRHKLLELTDKLQKLSCTDSLTGLFNRFQFDKTFKDVVAMSNRYNHLHAIFFIDVDHFKEVNDSYGHQAGDLVLQEVSKRLSSCLRTNDIISRLGGDEFAVILPIMKDKRAAEEVAKKINDIFSTPFIIDGNKLSIKVSMGIACYPEAGKTPETLMQNADIALYAAKKSGRNQYKFFVADEPT